jgi:hypothetical protein
MYTGTPAYLYFLRDNICLSFIISRVKHGQTPASDSASMHPKLDTAGVTVWLMMHQQQQLDRRLGYSVINFPSTLTI